MLSATRVVSARGILSRANAQTSSVRQTFSRRLLSSEETAAAKEVKASKVATATKEAATKSPPTAAVENSSLWNSAKFWGGAGAVAGWGMSGAAIYDAFVHGPDNISLNMTGVLIVYSSLFARWAFIVKPQNLLLASCHVTNVLAQCNQMRRALQYKTDIGEEDEVKDITMKAAATAAGAAGCIALGPTIQGALISSNLGLFSSIAAAEAGPFTVHFWAPMSKWLISGASFMDLNRPTDKISIAQYTALTFTGLFFSRYSLLVQPVNYVLCSVNIALFGSSAWHLGRKIDADYISGPDV